MTVTNWAGNIVFAASSPLRPASNNYDPAGKFRNEFLDDLLEG